MRLLLIVTVIATLFYLMTGLVYAEGGFEGALVVKPYPTYGVAFGGGEEGAWARHHPGQAPPWFMRKDLTVITGFSWEEGEPAWVTAYEWGFPVTLLAWVALAVIGAVRLIRFLAGREKPDEPLGADALPEGGVRARPWSSKKIRED